MLVTAGLIAFLTLYGLFEYWTHVQNLKSIPLRIHVNGTRGKSSVTRLIAGGLREGGLRVLAKTTGTAPRVILEDGTETRIYRPGSANIIEQVKFVAKAKERSANVIVVECMALQPELQRLSESQMVRSHIGVITNARADHFDVMGPSVHHVGQALSNTVPQNARFFTAETASPILDLFQNVCREKKTEFFAAKEDEVSWSDMQGFGYIEHRENVALALRVCEACGVRHDVALKGMRSAIPDPGVLRSYQVKYFDKDIQFFNVFAANDPDSTALIWNRLVPSLESDRKKIVLVNSRGDRIQRSEQMGILIAKNLPADVYILAGDYTKIIEDEAVRLGLDEDKIEDMGSRSVSDIFEMVLDYTGERSMVFAIGNIGGMGQSIVDFFKHRSGAGDRAGDRAGAHIEPYIF